MEDQSLPLPTMEEVLFCSDDTTVEEVSVVCDDNVHLYSASNSIQFVCLPVCLLPV